MTFLIAHFLATGRLARSGASAEGVQYDVRDAMVFSWRQTQTLELFDGEKARYQGWVHLLQIAF